MPKFLIDIRFHVEGDFDSASSAVGHLVSSLPEGKSFVVMGARLIDEHKVTPAGDNAGSAFCDI